MLVFYQSTHNLLRLRTLLRKNAILSAELSGAGASTALKLPGPVLHQYFPSTTTAASPELVALEQEATDCAGRARLC